MKESLRCITQYMPKTVVKAENPEGLCATMYHTGSHAGDAKMIEVYQKAKQLQGEGN